MVGGYPQALMLTKRTATWLEAEVGGGRWEEKEDEEEEEEEEEDVVLVDMMTSLS